MLRFFKIVGSSMKPTLLPGDYVLASKIFKKVFSKNDIVIFFDCCCSYIIKKVLISKKNHLYLINENKHTTSIFCEKPLNINKVKYKVLFILRLGKVKKIFNKLLVI